MSPRPFRVVANVWVHQPFTPIINNGFFHVCQIPTQLNHPHANHLSNSNHSISRREKSRETLLSPMHRNALAHLTYRLCSWYYRDVFPPSPSPPPAPPRPVLRSCHGHPRAFLPVAIVVDSNKHIWGQMGSFRRGRDQRFTDPRRREAHRKAGSCPPSQPLTHDAIFTLASSSILRVLSTKYDDVGKRVRGRRADSAWNRQCRRNQALKYDMNTVCGVKTDGGFGLDWSVQYNCNPREKL